MNINPTPQQVAKLCKETTLDGIANWVNNFNAMMGTDIPSLSVSMEMKASGADIPLKYVKEYMTLTLYGIDDTGGITGGLEARCDVRLARGVDPAEYLDHIHALIDPCRVFNHTVDTGLNLPTKTEGGPIRRRRWKEEENELFADPDLSNPDIAELLGRTVAAIQTRRVRLKKEGIIS